MRWRHLFSMQTDLLLMIRTTEIFDHKINNCCKNIKKNIFGKFSFFIWNLLKETITRVSSIKTSRTSCELLWNLNIVKNRTNVAVSVPILERNQLAWWRHHISRDAVKETARDDHERSNLHLEVFEKTQIFIETQIFISKIFFSKKIFEFHETQTFIENLILQNWQNVRDADDVIFTICQLDVQMTSWQFTSASLMTSLMTSL